jgi:hypothetical protein
MRILDLSIQDLGLGICPTISPTIPQSLPQRPNSNIQYCNSDFVGSLLNPLKTEKDLKGDKFQTMTILIWVNTFATVLSCQRWRGTDKNPSSLFYYSTSLFVNNSTYTPSSPTIPQFIPQGPPLSHCPTHNPRPSIVIYVHF